MTAIAGLWRFDGRSDADEACARMLAALTPYGADPRRWDGGEIALGRRLHRTVPEDAFDRQPLEGGDGTLRLVADVRLDNRQDLAVQLGLTTERTRTMSDAAMLLAAWERWEDGLFDHLVGDYAFALWDARARRLVLARDPLGHRPLFFHEGQGFVAFASMAKGLHALPEVPYAADEDQAAEALVLMPRAGERSFFKDISRVQPAHVVTIAAGGRASRRHWNPSRERLRLPDTAAYVEALRHHLGQAVASQLRGAESAVASHLSGGFDSASVAATAAMVMAPTGGRVVAFTAVPRPGYDGPDPRGRFGDEGPFAADTAALHPNIEHVRIVSGHRSPLEDLDREVFLGEMPVTNPCNGVWSRAINKAAQDRGLTVLLIGQAGNMTVSWDGTPLLVELVSQGRMLRWAREAWGLHRRGGYGLGGVLAQSFGPWMPAWLWSGLHKAFGRSAKDTFVHTAVAPSRFAELDLPARAAERALDLAYRPRRDGHAARLWVLDRGDGAAARKGTLAGYGLDIRDPTADRRLLEFCLSVPEEQWLKDGFRRKLGRLALADRLPAHVLNQRGKGLQAVDWHEGATAALPEIRAEIERLAENPAAARALDIPRLRRLVADWPQDGWHRNAVMEQYRLALLRGISVGHFLRKTSGGNG